MSANEPVATHDPAFTIRALRLDRNFEHDMALLHGWFQLDHAQFWGMQQHTSGQVSASYRQLLSSGHATAYLGYFDGLPSFLFESYQPIHDELGKHYDVHPGDLGMHCFVGPPQAARIPNFTRRVFGVLMSFMFEQLGAQRIVVEPDVRNHKVHALNQAMGFTSLNEVQLPHKRASLACCTRAGFLAALSNLPLNQSQNQRISSMNTLRQDHPAQPAKHLNPQVWAHVNRALVRKAIGEFSHELLLEPQVIGLAQRAGFKRYRLRAAGSEFEYTFDAQAMALRHWRIDETSIQKHQQDRELPLNALDFIIEFQQALGIKPALLPVYLDEISSTLYGAAYKRSKGNPTSAQLVDADYQTIESSMTEGHPGFVANNGRLGFDALDYLNYAPETGASFPLVWLAVHREQAHFASVSNISYQQLMHAELGGSTLARFEEQLRDQGLDIAQYIFMPTHAWQWLNKLAVGFSADIAEQRIVCLGYSQDHYAAQQSIRTYFNLDHPQRHYVKTSLSILNMGFMRGLSPYYMSGTPAINEWLGNKLDGDDWLRKNGFTVLREVASVGYRNRYYEAASSATSPYRKMLSALWRESPVAMLRGQERLMTMTALVHVDHDGAALLPQLIQRSGLSPQAWLARYLDAYLAPLLHCFYAHDLAFMPHGENLILVLDGHVPVRAILKDIAEETALMDKDAKLPGLAQRMVADVPQNYKLLTIFIDVFDGFFRHLSQILVDHCTCSEDDFWRLVADCVANYQSTHSHLQSKFEQYDLYAPDFLHSCLNRLQLADNQQMVNLDDQASSLKMAGLMANPIARFRPQ